MKRILLLLNSLFIIIGNLSADYSVVHEINEICENVKKTKSVNVGIQKSADEWLVSYTIPNVVETKLSEFTEESLWRINGFDLKSNPGMPMLPIKQDKYYIPENYEVVVEFETGDYIDFDTDIRICQEDQPDNAVSNLPTKEIKYQGFYPKIPLEREEDGVYRHN